jgi:hypothetical protein
MSRLSLKLRHEPSRCRATGSLLDVEAQLAPRLMKAETPTSPLQATPRADEAPD